MILSFHHMEDSITVLTEDLIQDLIVDLVDLDQVMPTVLHTMLEHELSIMQL